MHKKRSSILELKSNPMLKASTAAGSTPGTTVATGATSATLGTIARAPMSLAQSQAKSQGRQATIGDDEEEEEDEDETGKASDEEEEEENEEKTGENGRVTRAATRDACLLDGRRANAPRRKLSVRLRMRLAVLGTLPNTRPARYRGGSDLARGTTRR